MKLPADFFEDKAIKRLRQIAGGDTYTIIYLKMLLKSLEDAGKMYYEGIEDTIAEEIALDINESVDDVQVAINYLVKKGLMIVTENEAELLRMNEMIGSETDKAKLMRKLRKTRRESNDVTQIDNNVTKELPSVTKCYTDIDIEKEKDKEIEKDTDISSELIESPTEPTVISIPLNSGFRDIVQSEIDKWSNLYPNVDVMQQLRNMVGWCESNPTKRKTKTGVNRFINSWLSREQDKGGYRPQKQNNSWNFTDVDL